MQIAVLAGGLGTRLGSRTQRTPKSLVRVAGRPFLEHQLHLFQACGFQEVVLLVGHLGEQIRAFASDGMAFGLAVRYSDDGDLLLGTAGAVKRAESLLEDSFFLTYGDAFLPLDYRSILDYFQHGDRLGLMVVYRNENRLELSNVVTEGGLVTVYDKEHQVPGMDFINFGVSLLRKEALDLIPTGAPYSQEQWFQALIEGRQLIAYETSQRFYEIGSTRGLKEFERMISQPGAAAASGWP